ncbi:MAG: MFS transporter [Salinibacter sp.]|uniref:MFS transporter n=1 Tax=Salinibacter sp. TaxID=2065818 RepID=UPI0035D3DBC0
MAHSDNSPRRPHHDAGPSSGADPIFDLDLWLLFAVTVVGVGNVSSVSPTFPQVVEVFDISRVQVGWVVTAYSLPGLLSAPLAGIGADRFGRKRVLVPTLFVFGLAGGSCALARSFPVLLALRAVQGLAAAPLVGLAITIIGDRYDGVARATAVGYNATALNVGTAAYPAVGGTLAVWAWYWPFALPLLALPVGTAIAWTLGPPDSERQQGPGPFREYLAVVGARLGDRRVLGLLFVNLGIFVLIFGAFLTYVPELLDTRFGSSSVVAGAVLAAASVSSGLVATQLGRLATVFSLRRLIQGSLLIDAAALALMPLAPGAWGVGAAALLFGVAQGLNQPALQTRLTELSSDASRGVVLSVNGMALRLGQAIGPLLLGGALVVGDIGTVFYAAAGVGLLMGGAAVGLLGPE